MRLSIPDRWRLRSWGERCTLAAEVSTVNIRFVEDRNPEQVLDDVEMASPPAVGDRVRFRFADDEDQLWIVAEVEHVIDVKLTGISPDRVVTVICHLKSRFA